METSTSVDDYDPAITQHLTLVAALGAAGDDSNRVDLAKRIAACRLPSGNQGLKCWTQAVETKPVLRAYSRDRYHKNLLAKSAQ